MAFSLSGRVAAVTGAASGIGFACARAMVEQGARVALVDRNAEALNAACNTLGEQAFPVAVDLCDAASVDTMLPRILDRTGQLDVFHANAGSYVGGVVAEGDPDQWDRMLNLNINAAFRSVRAVLPHMIERGTGDILVTCSVAGHAPIQWEPV